MSLETVDTQNKQQYSDYPYPPRTPEDELRRLVAPMMDCFDVLNHRAYGGQKKFNESFRVLVVGGGTGDSVIFLAEQLRIVGATVEYIDLSENSIKIAKQRAENRKLNNIHWRQGSLLDLQAEEIGEFDYINCSGVLHHLEDPAAGLSRLKTLLKADGAMGIMLYGKYARAGVYQLQSLLSLLNQDAASLVGELEITRQLLESLPESNLFKQTESIFSDHRRGDAGIVDLLLHKNDRAYSVEELYEFVEEAGLELSAFVEPHLYRPDYYADNLSPELVESFKALNKRELQHVVELFCASIKTHSFYISHQRIEPPAISNKENIPSLPISSSPELNKQISEMVLRNLKAGKTGFKHGGRAINFKPSRALASALRFVDGSHSLKAIYQKASKESGVSEDGVERAFAAFYKSMARHGLIFLRGGDLPSYKYVEELEKQKDISEF